MAKCILKQVAISALINEANTHSNPVKRAYTRAAAIIEQIPAEAVQSADRWISVKDKLPTENALVLCYCHSLTGEGNSYMLGSQCRDGFWFMRNTGIRYESFPCNEYEVTHWMPLPEPPKDGDTP